MQLVAIQMADKPRRIEKRPRPARRHRIDLAQRLQAFLRIGSDHDRDVVLGQRRRQVDAGDDVERLQLDPGIFQQELDRRVAAHVDGGRERQNAQFRLFRRTWRPVQLMKGEHFRLNGHSRLPVTQQLRDQRQIEPLARVGRAGGKLRNQFVAQWAKIGTFECHRRQSARIQCGRRSGSAPDRSPRASSSSMAKPLPIADPVGAGRAALSSLATAAPTSPSARCKFPRAAASSGRPRFRDEARARADAKGRGRMFASQPSATGWPIRQAFAAFSFAAFSASSAERGTCRATGKRAVQRPAIFQGEDACPLPDHERIDRPLRQFFIVGEGVGRPLLRRQQTERR